MVGSGEEGKNKLMHNIYNQWHMNNFREKYEVTLDESKRLGSYKNCTNQKLFLIVDFSERQPKKLAFWLSKSKRMLGIPTKKDLNWLPPCWFKVVGIE